MTGSSVMQAPAARPSLPSNWLLWLVIGTPPVAWTLHLLLSYWIASVGCDWREAVLKGVLFGVSALLAVLTALSVLTAWRLRRETVTDETRQTLATIDIHADTDRGRRNFMAFGGVFLGIYFLTAIVMESIPIVMLGGCS